MAGARAGVAVKIQELEPRAVFTHCYGHALNLAVNDTSLSFHQNERPCYLNLKKRSFFITAIVNSRNYTCMH